MSRSSGEECKAQPQTSSKNARSEILFARGNGGFGDHNKQNPKLEVPSEGPTSVSVPVLPFVNPIPTYPTLGHALGPGKKMMFNNNEMINPWGDRMTLSGPPVLNVPPPHIPRTPSWTPSSKSPSLSPVGSPGRGRSSKRSSRELLELLSRRDYEADRLKKAKEREESLRREEEKIEEAKLYKLKSEVRKLEEKRKQQEWQTYRRHERLMRKKEEISQADRERERRDRRRSRSRSLSAHKSRRSRSRNRDHSRRTRRSRNTPRRSRSSSHVSPAQKRNPVRREHKAIVEALTSLANERESRYVRYRDSRSVSTPRSPRLDRRESRSRIPRRTCQERRDSNDGRRERSGPSGRGREDRSRHRAVTRARGRERSRSPGRRFRY